MTARNEILTRIRSALHVQDCDPAASHERIRRSYNRVGKLTATACMDLFVNRIVDYDAEILQIQREGELADAIAEVLLRANEQSAIVASSFPVSWLPPGIAFKTDNNHLSTDEIESIQAVVTTCEAAIASTGTLIMVHHEAQARRILTLLPNHHICLVRRDQVFELLPEAIETVAHWATHPITTISGPSATSDIEMTRVGGVHGPRHLSVILYGVLNSQA
jgi:L-lactate dehydrogenase complex protein LldG